MNTITATYSLKWQLKSAPSYQVTACGKVFNIGTGRRIKKCLNGGSVGFWVAGRWMPLAQVRNNLERIPKVDCPF
jgi:hypothetical protein